MNKYLRNFLLIMLFLAFISTVSYCSAPYDTETAQIINIRKTVSGEGYIIRNEKIVTPVSKGAFEASVQDGERISRGGSLGVVISGNYSEDLVKKLKTITKRIDEIEASNSFSDIYASDEARIFSGLKNFTADIREDVFSHDYISASEKSTQLGALLRKSENTDNRGSEANLLSELKAQKYELEQQLGGIREDVKAPSSGLFYATLDGLERAVKEEELLQTTPSDIVKYEETMKNFVQSAENAGKTVDTYVWYLSAVVPLKEAELLTAGSSVQLSIDESVSVKATVVAINPDEFQRSAIILKCTHDVKDIFEKRRVDFEICYEEYRGLYVPAAAVRVKGDVTGVYVINRNEAVSFRAINILLKEEDYYIVRSNYSPSAEVGYKALKLYDDILVNPEVARIDESEE